MPSLWFQVHRALQAVAVVLQIALLTLTARFNSMDSSLLSVHGTIGWIVTGMLGVQFGVAALLRPAQDAPRRRLWVLSHAGLGVAVLSLALVNVCIGIALYHRNRYGVSNLYMPLSGWVRLGTASKRACTACPP